MIVWIRFWKGILAVRSRLFRGRRSSSPACKAQAIPYAVPTICDAIPRLSSEPVDGTEFQISEDDWRQWELLPAGLAGVVEHEFSKILRVRAGRVPGAGWSEIRVRSQPRRPLDGGLLLCDLEQRAASSEGLMKLAYRDNAWRIDQGFALPLPGWMLYGEAPAGRVHSLALLRCAPAPADSQSAAFLEALAGDLDLELVHWCRCLRARPGTRKFESLLAGP